MSNRLTNLGLVVALVALATLLSVSATARAIPNPEPVPDLVPCLAKGAGKIIVVTPDERPSECVEALSILLSASPNPARRSDLVTFSFSVSPGPTDCWDSFGNNFGMTSGAGFQRGIADQSDPFYWEVTCVGNGFERSTLWIDIVDEPPPPAPTPTCRDGIDNDGDTLIDWGIDPDCLSRDDAENEYNAPPPPAPAPSVWLTANPASIASGQASELRWSSANTSNCSAPWTSSTATSGSATVWPTATTTYSITCYSGDGRGASASATVTVTAAPPPPPPSPSPPPEATYEGPEELVGSGRVVTFGASLAPCYWAHWQKRGGISYPYRRSLQLRGTWCVRSGRITNWSFDVWTTVDGLCRTTGGPTQTLEAGGRGETFLVIRARAEFGCTIVTPQVTFDYNVQHSLAIRFLNNGHSEVRR